MSNETSELHDKAVAYAKESEECFEAIRRTQTIDIAVPQDFFVTMNKEFDDNTFGHIGWWYPSYNIHLGKMGGPAPRTLTGMQMLSVLAYRCITYKQQEAEQDSFVLMQILDVINGFAEICADKCDTPAEETWYTFDKIRNLCMGKS